MAVQTPSYWAEERYQPLVEVETAYGNKVEIPKDFVPYWEVWLKHRKMVSETFEREKARGWGRKETPNPKRRAIIAQDYQKVFIEDYHE